MIFRAMGNCSGETGSAGINFIDSWRLGPQDNLPPHMANHPARNTYFFLPLLLGLMGLFYHLKRNIKDFAIVLLLFFFTGLAIIIYLNQTPLQPRERDYTYAGSFLAFSIWIGMGVLALIEWMNKKLPSETKQYSGNCSCFLLVPVLWPGRTGMTMTVPAGILPGTLHLTT
jgi:hypothetical protein